MSAAAVAIETDDGVCDAHVFHPDGAGAWPALILYMDGVGIRPALREMAERFASHGYSVLLPNIYYRAGPARPIANAAEALGDEAEREEMWKRSRMLNNQLIAKDTGGFIAFLDGEPSADASRIGCVGYCMGGGHVLTAAGTYPDRVVAAASLHGGGLATDKPDSPHLLADRMRAKLYFGVAEIDPYLEPGEMDRLKAVLDGASVSNTIELYPGVEHGFVARDMPFYDRTASERHWDRVLALFAETLGGSKN